MILRLKKFMKIFKKLVLNFNTNKEILQYKNNLLLMDYFLKIKNLYKITPFLFRSFIVYFKFFLKEIFFI